MECKPVALMPLLAIASLANAGFVKLTIVGRDERPEPITPPIDSIWTVPFGSSEWVTTVGERVFGGSVMIT